MTVPHPAIRQKQQMASEYTGSAILKIRDGKGWEDLLVEFKLPQKDEFWMRWARNLTFSFGGKRDA